MAPTQSRPSFVRQVSRPTANSSAASCSSIVKSSIGWHRPTPENDPSLSDFELEYDGNRTWAKYVPTAKEHSRSTYTGSSQYDRHVRFAPTVLVQKVPRVAIHRNSCAVNPILSVDTEPRVLAYDICMPPVAISADLSQPAISPPAHKLRIACDLIPWSIDILNPGGITCSQVLTALYQTLQHRIRPDEWATRSSKQKDKITQAYLRRCSQCVAFGRPEKEEQLKGVRRVDWLMRQTVFAGLAPSYDGDDTWILTLAPN